MGIEAITPPIEPLRQVLDRLKAHDITAALGGSGLLHAHGLVDRVNDWDLTTDAAPATVAAALDGLSYEDRTGGGNYRTAGRFVIHADGLEIDLICGFAVNGCALPTLVTGEWQGIPLGSLEVWAAAYWLIDRPAKAELVLAHLHRHGTNRERLQRVMREPLPLLLRVALEELP